MAYITILGSIATMIMPDSCFVSDILVNIHTMWLHFGSFVVSVYLLMSNKEKRSIKILKQAIIVFLIFVIVALVMNITVYNIGILNGETFDMFYIIPYFVSTLPIFYIIQQNFPYLLYLAIYIIVIIIGAYVIYNIARLIKYIGNKLS